VDLNFKSFYKTKLSPSFDRKDAFSKKHGENVFKDKNKNLSPKQRQEDNQKN
jgi:hypothetical protein